jgi:hypothetical protein
MRMSEADYEYLIHTLSEARFRAAEIAVSVRSRVGVDHKLAQLGNVAVSRIEGVLVDVRKLATENEGGRSRFVGAPERKAAIVLPEPIAQMPAPSFTLPSGLGPDHWLHGFLKDLLAQIRATNNITFENAEKLLQQRKAVFLRDAETARRMVRTYPQLFNEGSNQTSGM